METNETNNGQARAPKGGCVGVNGEFYEGGKFLPGNEDRPKTAPGLRAEPPAPAWLIAKREEEARKFALFAAWLHAKRDLVIDICQALMRRPSPEFYASLGRQLWCNGWISNRQTAFVLRFLYGRRNKANAAAWDRTERLCIADCPVVF